MEKSRLKSFVGGIVIGLLVGVTTGIFGTLLVVGTAFINANLK